MAYGKRYVQYRIDKLGISSKFRETEKGALNCAGRLAKAGTRNRVSVYMTWFDDNGRFCEELIQRF